MNQDYKSHPSYGQIVLTKPHSGGEGANLFGSKVKHPSYISMEINEAVIAEDGFSEHVFGRKTIVKLNMSEAQWSHMVSSFGNGGGTPVTLSYRQDQGSIERPPAPVSVIDLAHRSADKTKQNLVNSLKGLEQDVKTLSTKQGTVTKKDLSKLAMDFNVLASCLDSNFDFLENQVKERMEKEVAKANIEIEAIISNAVQRLGREALATKLEQGEDVEKVLGS